MFSELDRHFHMARPIVSAREPETVLIRNPLFRPGPAAPVDGHLVEQLRERFLGARWAKVDSRPRREPRFYQFNIDRPEFRLAPMARANGSAGQKEMTALVTDTHRLVSHGPE
jgi:hypothetical protein